MAGAASPIFVSAFEAIDPRSKRCAVKARLIEWDALYCDVIIRRFEAYTGKRAMLESTGAAFEDRGTGQSGTSTRVTVLRSYAGRTKREDRTGR
jgi:hypothetical protein